MTLILQTNWNIFAVLATNKWHQNYTASFGRHLDTAETGSTAVTDIETQTKAYTTITTWTEKLGEEKDDKYALALYSHASHNPKQFICILLYNY